jgi:hypothetical protein
VLNGKLTIDADGLSLWLFTALGSLVPFALGVLAIITAHTTKAPRVILGVGLLCIAIALFCLLSAVASTYQRVLQVPGHIKKMRLTYRYLGISIEREIDQLEITSLSYVVANENGEWPIPFLEVTLTDGTNWTVLASEEDAQRASELLRLPLLRRTYTKVMESAFGPAPVIWKARRILMPVSGAR